MHKHRSPKGAVAGCLVVAALTTAACKGAPLGELGCAGDSECELGWICAGAVGCVQLCTSRVECVAGQGCQGGVCVTIPTGCNNGAIDGQEACDDANNDDGDGCGSTCATEDGFSCAGVPSVCVAICGDGKVRGGETCDDDNRAAGDGCDASCLSEPGCTCVEPGLPCWCSPCPVCEASQLCVGMTCVERCGTSQGCAPGQVCVDPPELDPYCTSSADLAVRGGLSGAAEASGASFRVRGGLLPFGGAAGGMTMGVWPR